MLVATVKSITANGLEAMGRHVIQPAAEKRIDRQVFYSSGSQALEERLGSQSAAERQFVWNLGYVDDLVLRDRDTTDDGALDERLYSLPDLRYSVMALTDDSGNVVERLTYDAYGTTSAWKLFASRASTNYDWEFRYTGRREDLNTGLYYFRARYYSAQLGRFISRDPLGFVDGMSLYRAYFVPGGTDPEGKQKSRFWFCFNRYVRVTTGGAYTSLGAFCMFRRLVQLKLTAGSKWNNDKYAHCVASCRAAKDCGRFLSFTGGEAKEFYDCLGGGTPDQEDLNANSDGRKCAGWESQLPAGTVISVCTLVFRKTCHECCVDKGHGPFK